MNTILRELKERSLLRRMAKLDTGSYSQHQQHQLANSARKVFQLPELAAYDVAETYSLTGQALSEYVSVQNPFYTATRGIVLKGPLPYEKRDESCFCIENFSAGSRY